MPHQERQQKKILVMDDEESVLGLMKDMLIRGGYDVTLTQYETETVAACQNALVAGAPFDLVILDLQVDLGMAGIRTLHGIKAIDPNVKAILSTGSSGDPVTLQYREFGFSGVLNKPFRMQQLLDLIQKIIG